MAEGAALERHVRDDRRRPLVAVGEMRVKGADVERLESGAPAQRIDRMAAGGEQVAASALARAHPVPPAVPVGHARQILRAREADVAQPAVGAQPPREFQERVVAQLERHDRADARRPHGVANAHELRDVEAGRLLEHEVLARLGGGHGLLGVQVVRRRDRDDVHVGRREHLVVVRGDAASGSVEAGTSARLARVRSASRPHSQVTSVSRIALKRGDVLRRAPADAADGDAKFSSASGHFSGS